MSGNRVKATWIEWMAAGYPATTKEDTLEESVLLNRFISIVRARRSEATHRWHHPRPSQLVATYQPESDPLQLDLLILERSTKSLTASLISWESETAAPARAMKTTSQPTSHFLDRTASLSILLTRLRTTAFPTRLLTEKPTLCTSRPLGTALITSKRLAQDLPSLYTLAKSLLRVRRSSLLIANAGKKRSKTLLYSQPVTTDQPPRLQHVPPPPSSHPESEPVHSLAV